jgi:hypothetical protein
MKFDRHSVFGLTDIVVSNAGVQRAARLAPRQKDRAAAGRGAVMLAVAAELLVAAIGAPAAGESAQLQPTAERAGEDSVRVQPTASQFAPPSQPDVSASDAGYVDELYRQLIGPPAATSSDFAMSDWNWHKPIAGSAAA